MNFIIIQCTLIKYTNATQRNKYDNRGLKSHFCIKIKVFIR